MGSRLELQTLLETMGALEVYFQPPENSQMEYPCIVYNRDDAETLFADNNPYRYMQRYTVTLIDRDPDSPVLDKIKELPRCTFNRFFTVDNLNHDVFTLFF